MGTFAFHLQPVLDHREVIERQHRVAVGRLQRARDQVEERVRRLQADLAGDREQMRALAAGDARGIVAVDRVRLAAAASMHGLIRLQRAAIELAGAQQRLAAGRSKLLAARVARKGVGVLRERALWAWKQEENRKESAALDDISARLGRGAPPGDGGA